ncbi:MAG TPA: hypothetical protein VFQ34_04765 [Nitrospiraceae bacterium]|nr:hypothetical protein [Nitrospiraceae bacterium]
MVMQYPHVLTDIEIGQDTGAQGQTLGVLTLVTEKSEFSFWVTPQICDVLEQAVATIRPWLKPPGDA